MRALQVLAIALTWRAVARHAGGGMSNRTTWAMMLLLCGCSEDNPISPTPEDCTGPVQVSVSSGATPTFAWTPLCSLFFVLVEPESSGADQWGVISDSTNAISPPVVYGVVPPGARELTPPEALVSGITYEVLVFRWTGPGEEDGELVGQQKFTP